MKLPLYFRNYFSQDLFHQHFLIDQHKGKLIIDITLFVSNHMVNTVRGNSPLQSLMWLHWPFLRKSWRQKWLCNIFTKKNQILCMIYIYLSLQAPSAWREQVSDQWSNCFSQYIKIIVNGLKPMVWMKTVGWSSRL